MRILFFGHNQWAVLTLQGLLDAGHEILRCITETEAFDANERENYRRFAEFGAFGDVAEFCAKRGIPVDRPEDCQTPDEIEKLARLNPDLVVCVSYHAIFKAPFLRKFAGRVINAHVAPLPYYRGRAPLNWAIINGEKRHGLTVHFINEGIDTGPILHQEFCDIGDEDRAIDLLLRLLPLFPVAVLKAMEEVARGEKGVTQDPHSGSYFPRRTPADGKIHFDRETSRDIHNKVRALAYPYPGAFFEFNGEKFIVNRSAYQDQKRISPVPGVVYLKSPQGFWVTTVDGSIEMIDVSRGGAKIESPRFLFKLGTRLTGN